MNGVQRFLSRREKRPKSNGEVVPPTKDAGRLLHTPSDEKRKSDKEEDKKIKEVVQRLAAEHITVREGQAEDVLRLPSINGHIEHAVTLLRLYDDASHGKIHAADPHLNMVGAVNRENVTCYLDSLLFSMFARTDSFEGILSAEYPDEPRKRLVTLLRLWVNMLRTGKLITTDITQKLQEALKECGWPEAALLRQQDVSEAFGFITGKLDLPLLTLKMDVYHTGKEDRDDHRIVRERLLDVAIPPPPQDGSVIRLEDCLEQYFNNKIEVKRHLQRRNTLQSVKPEKGMDVETLEVVETPTTEQPNHVEFTASPSRPTEYRRRGQSIFGQRKIEDGTEKRTHDDIGIGGNRTRANTIKREVLMPAWQFFSLIPWYTHDHPSNPIKTDEQVVVHLQTKRPVLGICLKRYSMTTSGVGSRLDTFIDIPVEIGIPHFISDDCGHGDEGYEPNFTNFKLSLLAVICHRGKSLDAGHYIALVRGREDSHGQATQWLRFDDLAQQRIATVDIQKALRDECPYLLFYQTRPIDDDDVSDKDEPPSYDEATTDTSNGELSRVATMNDISEPMVTTEVIPIPASQSQETLTSNTNTASTAPTRATVVTEATSADLDQVVSDPEAHAKTVDPPSGHLEVKGSEEAKPKSIDLAGLAAPNANTSKQSLDIPRGRSSFQDSSHRHSMSIEENKKGGFSVPVTPEDSRQSWIGGMTSSRRNSLAKVWKPRSRPSSQSGEGRKSMSFIRNMMSKDKLHEASASEEHSGHGTPHVSMSGDLHAEEHHEQTLEHKSDLPRRSKSLRHKKGKRSSSIGRMLEINSGHGEGKSKKVPDRECVVM